MTFASPTQINFQVPTIPVNSAVNVQVLSNCGASNELQSAVQSVPTAAAAPEFLYWLKNANGSDPVVAVDVGHRRIYRRGGVDSRSQLHACETRRDSDHLWRVVRPYESHRDAGHAAHRSSAEHLHARGYPGDDQSGSCGDFLRRRIPRHGRLVPAQYPGSRIHRRWGLPADDDFGNVHDSRGWIYYGEELAGARSQRGVQAYPLTI